MKMYRYVTNKELDNMAKGKQVTSNNNYSGMNFFKYYEHAKMYLSYYGNMIIGCDVPNDLIEEMDYVNFYPFKRFEVGAPIPEYIINRDNFDYTFITEINPSVDDADGKLYNNFLMEMYNEWKKINKKYRNDKYGFYDYVVEYLKNRDLDEVIREYGINKKRIKK